MARPCQLGTGSLALRPRNIFLSFRLGTDADEARDEDGGCEGGSDKKLVHT